MLGKHKYKWPYLLLFSICLSTTSPSTLSPTNFLFSFLTNSPLSRPSFFSSPPCTNSPSHLLGMLYTSISFFTPCIIQGGQTSPSLHPHSSILSLKHCMVGISLNLITFIYYHLPRWNINIKYPTSPCTAHFISLNLKQIIFPNSCLSIFFMVQPLSLSPIPLQAKDWWKKLTNRRQAT